MFSPMIKQSGRPRRIASGMAGKNIKHQQIERVVATTNDRGELFVVGPPESA